MSHTLNQAENQVDQTGVSVAVVILGIIGVSDFLTLPVLVSGFAADFGFSDKQVGSIASAHLAGIGIDCLLNLWLVRRFDWRTIGLLGVVGLALTVGASIVL